MDLDDLKQKGAALSPWAHIATVRPDGTPDEPASPQVAFIAVVPERAVYLAAYGMRGTEHWRRA